MGALTGFDKSINVSIHPGWRPKVIQTYYATCVKIYIRVRKKETSRWLGLLYAANNRMVD